MYRKYMQCVWKNVDHMLKNVNHAFERFKIQVEFFSHLSEKCNPKNIQICMKKMVHVYKKMFLTKNAQHTLDKSSHKKYT